MVILVNCITKLEQWGIFYYPLLVYLRSPIAWLTYFDNVSSREYPRFTVFYMFQELVAASSNSSSSLSKILSMQVHITINFIYSELFKTLRFVFCISQCSFLIVCLVLYSISIPRTYSQNLF